MDTWKGFSDVELQRLKREASQQSAGERAKRRDFGESRASGERRDDHAQTSNRRPSQRSSHYQQREEEPRTPSNEEAEVKIRLKGNAECLKTHAKDALVEVKGVLNDSVPEPDSLTKSQADASETEAGKEDRISFDCPASSLEDLQRRQREIEEENKRKKALLEKAVQERYVQSQAEVRKLHVVKEELDRLDFLVTRDVSILREKIEAANREFNSARRRFEEAEKEYIEAKVHLYQASEVKELLSEHLCAVIQHNEARKSTKLEELMSKLQMGGSSNEERSGGEKLDNNRAVLFKTPTPGRDVWPAITKRQRSVTTTTAKSVNDSQQTAGSGSNEKDILTAAADKERSKEKEAKIEVSTPELKLAAAAAGTSISSGHGKGEEQACSSAGSLSDIKSAAPRMD